MKTMLAVMALLVMPLMVKADGFEFSSEVNTIRTQSSFGTSFSFVPNNTVFLAQRSFFFQRAVPVFVGPRKTVIRQRGLLLPRRTVIRQRF